MNGYDSPRGKPGDTPGETKEKSTIDRITEEFTKQAEKLGYGKRPDVNPQPETPGYSDQESQTEANLASKVSQFYKSHPAVVHRFQVHSIGLEPHVRSLDQKPA